MIEHSEWAAGWKPRRTVPEDAPVALDRAVASGGGTSRIDADSGWVNLGGATYAAAWPAGPRAPPDQRGGERSRVAVVTVVPAACLGGRTIAERGPDGSALQGSQRMDPRRRGTA